MTPLTDSADSPATAPSRWAVALGNDGALGRKARHQLLAGYWYPAYAYLVASGVSIDEAPTLVESLIAAIVEEGSRESEAVPRFREFLLSRTKAALDGEPRREPVIVINRKWALERFGSEPAKAPTALFQRRWALTVLEFTLTVMEREYTAQNKLPLYNEIAGFLGYGEAEDRYDVPAKRLDMSTSAVRLAVDKLRQRYRDVVRAQIADTLLRPEDVEDEMKTLLGLLN
jgi:hypothetical protein